MSLCRHDLGKVGHAGFRVQEFLEVAAMAPDVQVRAAFPQPDHGDK